MEASWKYKEYFSARGWAENIPYPGIHQVLDSLQKEGMQLAIATSKPEEFALRIAEHFDLLPYFSLVCGAPMQESDAGKKENVIAAALQRLGSPKREEVIMVGDRKHDIDGAHKNDLPAIGVLYGYGSREELTAAGADYITESVQSLYALLRNGR